MLKILYLDDYLAIVHKPAGWLVHRTLLDKGETRFVLQTLRDQLGRPVWPLHRLDKGTSGVLAFALDANTARIMGQRFETGEGLHKTYRAIVRGWPADTLLIDHALKRMPDDMRTERMAYQPAQTQLRTLRRGELPLRQGDFARTRFAEVELQPLTGRRHQLRRHMKHIAHPIIGDATHGKGPLNRTLAEHLGVSRLWLHALCLVLRHPLNDHHLSIESPLDAEWLIWEASNKRVKESTGAELSPP